MSPSARPWPGPECLRSSSEQDTRRYTALVMDGYSPSHAYAMVVEERSERRAESWLRTRDIFELRAKAARRMEAALLWLEQADACDTGLAVAERCMSPEQALREAAEHPSGEMLLHWVAETLSVEACPYCCEITKKDAVSRIMGSAAWAALPFHQDPPEVAARLEEVARG